MNTEILEIDKAEHELTIQALHEQADKLEKEKDETNNLIIKDITQNFILQIEKEIEYQEFHIQELDKSLNFEKNKVEKGGNE